MRILLITAAILAASAAPASALIVQEDVFCDHGRYMTDCGPGPELRVVSGQPDWPGADGANDITVERRGGGVVVRDPLTRVHARGRCRSTGEHEAVCPGAAPSARVAAGAGNDRVVVIGMPATVEGADGDDELRGGDANDVLSGSAGADTLVGGGGDDQLVRGDYGGTYVPDVMMDGGPGRDLANLFDGPTVAVDLADDTLDGRPVLPGVEDVIGSPYSGFATRGNRLVGDRGPNRLFGSDLDDVIDGNGGDDRLITGGGNDVARGGGGDDVIVAAGLAPRPGPLGEPGTDAIECGAGRDHVREARLRDRIAADCDRVTGELRVRVTPLGERGVRVRVLERCRCKTFAVWILDAADGRALGVRRVPGARVRRRSIVVRLNAMGRRRMDHPGDLRVFVAGYRDGQPAGSTVVDLRS